jgi:hypothetical protein
VTLERDRHSLRQSAPRVSTEKGIQIEESDKHLKKTPSSIHERDESGSNVTAESDLQSKKHDLESRSTDDGMQIDESDEQSRNAESPRIET